VEESSSQMLSACGRLGGPARMLIGILLFVPHLYSTLCARQFCQGEGRACREVGVAHSVLLRMWFDNDLASELASSRRRHEANDIRFVLPALSSPMESLAF